jgi:large subunit ribosomal protein L13Ae
LRLKNFRKFCVLGDLCTQVGWKRQDIIETMETKRKTRSKGFWEKKINVLKKRKQAAGNAEFKAAREKLAQLGY